MANQLAQGKHAFTRSPVELVFGRGGQRPRRLLVNAVPIANEMLGLWTTHRSLLCQVNMGYAGYYPFPAAAPQPPAVVSADKLSVGCGKFCPRAICNIHHARKFSAAQHRGYHFRAYP